MVRTSKPHSRADTHRKGNPDAPGGWKHDLHEEVRQSLASRLASSSSSSKSNLLSRITDKRGQELLPDDRVPKLHGFDKSLPVNRNSNPNAGVELIAPAAAGRKKGASRIVDSRVVASGLSAAGLGGQQRVREVRPVFRESRSNGGNIGVSIAGAAKGSIWVRVENLAPETTPDDVMSAFAPSPILSACLSPQQGRLVSVDLEFASRQPAEEIIAQYNGVVADGNTLRVTVVRPNLGERIGSGSGGVGGNGLGPRGDASRARGPVELIDAPRSGKLYSDNILAANPTAAILTVGNTESSSRPRTEVWTRGSSSLASRVGK